MPVALSNDHVVLSSHDLCRIVQDDIAVLASCDKDPGRATLVIHPIGTPDQFVVPTGRKECDEQPRSKETVGKVSAVGSCSGPVRGGEAAAQLHVQRRLSQVQLEKLQGGTGAEGGIELLG